MHTWNYRRNSDAMRPVIFTKTRLILASFGTLEGSKKALYLQFHADSKQLTVASAATDDDVKRQSIVLEQTVEGESGSSDSLQFKLKFFIASGKCVAGKDPHLLPNIEEPGGSTLDIIRNNFDNKTPMCEELVVASCDDQKSLVFQTEPEEGFFALSYSLMVGSEMASGCMRVRPIDGTKDYVRVTPLNDMGDLQIPPQRIAHKLPQENFFIESSQLPLQPSAPRICFQVC